MSTEKAIEHIQQVLRFKDEQIQVKRDLEVELLGRIEDLKTDRDQWKKFYEECAKGLIPRIITEDELEVGQIIASVRPGAHVPVVGGLVTKTYGASDGFLEVELNGDKKIIGLAGGSLYVLHEAQKPERRGEVINPEDLRKGDVVDLWHFSDVNEPYYPNQVIESTSPLRGQAFNFDGLNFSTRHFEFRLVERPKPELPVDHGEVILVEDVTSAASASLRKSLPFFASFSFGEFTTWESLDGKWEIAPHWITKWRPAKVTVE